MAHVKFSMGDAIALTNSVTGETMFLTCEGVEISPDQWQQILEEPETVDFIQIKFKRDVNNDCVRAYLEVGGGA